MMVEGDKVAPELITSQARKWISYTEKVTWKEGNVQCVERG